MVEGASWTWVAVTHCLSIIEVTKGARGAGYWLGGSRGTDMTQRTGVTLVVV